MVEGIGVVGDPACAQSGNEELEKVEEKDNVEAQGAQRLRREEGDDRRGWKAKFTHHFTAFQMPCQVIPYVVIIRMMRSRGVS